MSSQHMTMMEQGLTTKQAYDRMLGNLTPKSKIVNHFSNYILVALLVIGIVQSVMGSSASFPGSTMGWVTMGLGGLYMGVKLLGGNLKARSIDLIASALITTAVMLLGGLSGAGILAPNYLGYALIGVIALTLLSSINMMTYARHQEQGET